MGHRAHNPRPSILNPRTKNGRQTAYAVRINRITIHTLNPIKEHLNRV